MLQILFQKALNPPWNIHCGHRQLYYNELIKCKH